MSEHDAVELSRWYEDTIGVPPLIRINGKAPIDEGWTKGPRDDPDSWRALLSQYTGNVGMLTGRLRSGLYLVVVDADARIPEWEDSLHRLYALGMPRETVTVLTGGGGVHLYFVSPVPVRKGSLRDFPGIDIQAEGAQVVVPYSTHPLTSNTYDFEYGWRIDDVQLATLPANIIELFGGARERQQRADVLDRSPAIEATVRLLEAHFGAHDVRARGDHIELTRPGKDSGVSGTVGALEDPGAFYCFTSSWSPFEREHAYSERELRKMAKLPSRSAIVATAITRVHDDALDWDDPLPLLDLTVLPDFPVDALPDWITAYVTQVSRAIQTPIDLAGTLALGVLSAAAAGRVMVHARAGWREPVNLFVAVAMHSGERKSPVFERMLAPLHEYEREVVEASVDAIKRAQLERAALEARARQLRSKAAKAVAPEARVKLEEEAMSLALQANAVEIPVSPRLLTDDVTPEALAELMAKHRGQMAIVSDEAGVFDMMAGRYGRFPNLDVYLKGHAGTPLRVDRKSSAPLLIEHPALTCVLTFQPSVLRDIYGRRENRERGLLARWHFVAPRSMVGARVTRTAPIAEGIEQLYIERMTDLTRELARWSDPLEVHLNLDAAEQCDDFRDEIEVQLRPDGELEHVADYAGKLAGAAVRVAGLLHVAGEPDPARWRQMVTQPVYEAAERIARYWLSHTLAVRKLASADGAVRDAVRVARWAARLSAPFTARDVQHGVSGFQTSGSVKPVIELLCELGWLRGLDPKPRIGRPTQRYEAHPNLTAHLKVDE